MGVLYDDIGERDCLDPCLTGVVVLESKSDGGLVNRSVSKSEKSKE